MDYMILYRDKRRFGGNRLLAILRDGEKCMSCGMTRNAHREKYGRDITVDHIDGNGRDSEFQNNSIDNLITLCLKCHGKKDSKRKRPYNEIPLASRKKMLRNLKYYREGGSYGLSNDRRI